MPKVEIGHVCGVYVRAEANEASVEELARLARAEFDHACSVVAGTSPGPAGGLNTERRGERPLGFGQRHAQAPVPYQHHDGGEL